MIPDLMFKSIKHVYKNYPMHLNGQVLETGYKPDYVLKKGNKYVILESENSSSRKTYVGGLMKAAHFLQNERRGILIFVIVPKVNTKASTIASHLKVYLNWVASKTNLKDVYVIEASAYFSKNKLIEICSADFHKCAYRV